jgi:hypothetical protein
LKVVGLDTKLKGASCDSCWLRSTFGYQHSSNPITDPAIFETHFQPITSSSGLLVYQLGQEDVGKYLTFQARFDNTTYYAASVLGPIIAGPPRMLDLQIVGTMKQGEEIRAVGRYIGGTEGSSEYWWMRIRDGVRETITEPSSSAAGMYTISQDDVGCVLKVKCRPIRDDGARGEIFTSKASDEIVSAETRVAAVNHSSESTQLNDQTPS